MHLSKYIGFVFHRVNDIIYDRWYGLEGVVSGHRLATVLEVWNLGRGLRRVTLRLRDRGLDNKDRPTFDVAVVVPRMQNYRDIRRRLWHALGDA